MLTLNNFLVIFACVAWQLMRADNHHGADTCGSLRGISFQPVGIVARNLCVVARCVTKVYPWTLLREREAVSVIIYFFLSLCNLRAPPRCGCVLCLSVVLSLFQFRVSVALVQWILKLSNTGSRAKTLFLFWLQTCSEQRKGQHQERQPANPMLTSQTNLKIIRYNVHLLHIACGLWLRIFICPRQITPSPEKQSDAKLIEVLDCSQCMHRQWRDFLYKDDYNNWFSTISSVCDLPRVQSGSSHPTAPRHVDPWSNETGHTSTDQLGHQGDFTYNEECYECVIIAHVNVAIFEL